MSVHLLFLACPSKAARPLVDELMDKLNNNSAQVVKYGVMCKAQLGFIILACQNGFPISFFDAIKTDEEITGYVDVLMDVFVSDNEPGSLQEQEGKA